MNKKLALIAISCTVLILLGGLNSSYLYGLQFITSKPELMLTIGEPVDWWDCNWSYYKKITIDHDKVASNFTNFPVLLYEASDAELAAYAQEDGDDIVFVDQNHYTQFPHHLEYFSGSTGKMIAWVNVSYVRCDEDTLLYMYYGNPDCSSQQDAEGTWNNGYMMVQHLSETSGTHLDSTANNNDGTCSGGVVQGTTGRAVLDGCDSFDGIDDVIDCDTSTSLNITDSLTLEAWVKDPPLDTAEKPIRIVNKQNTTVPVIPGRLLTLERTIEALQPTTVVFVTFYNPGVVLKDIVVNNTDVFSHTYLAGCPTSALEQRLERYRVRLPSKIQQYSHVAYTKEFAVTSHQTVQLHFKPSVFSPCFPEGNISYFVVTPNGTYDVETTTHWRLLPLLSEWWDPGGVTQAILQFVTNLFVQNTATDTVVSKPVRDEFQPENFSLLARGETWNKYFNPLTHQYSLFMSVDPLNYLNETNEWVPINTTVEPSVSRVGEETFDFGMTRGNYQAFFKNNASTTESQPMVFTRQNYSISFTPPSVLRLDDGTLLGQKKESSATLSKNSVTYSNIFDEGFDLQYNCFATGLQEVLTIDSKNRIPPLKENDASLILNESVHVQNLDDLINTSGLQIVYGNGSVPYHVFNQHTGDRVTTVDEFLFQNNINQTIFLIPRLYGWDSNSSPDPLNRLLLNKTLIQTQTGEMFLEIQVPYSWLNDPERIYPIHIDADIEISPSSWKHDASENVANSTFYNHSTSIYVITSSTTSASYIGGWIYSGVTIPQGARIDNAYMRLYPITWDDPHCYIYLHDVDNALDFLSRPCVTGRIKTTAYAKEWRNNTGTSTWVNTTDFSSPVQEVIDRTGWSSGNSICVIFWCNTHGTTYRYYPAAWEYSDHSYGAQLRINYTAEEPTIRTDAATGVEETNATLRGYLQDDGGYDTYVGLRYDVNPGIPYARNMSLGKIKIGSFSWNIGSFVPLLPGKMYFFQAWGNNSRGYNDTANEKYFLTKPIKPSSFTIGLVSTNKINLSWTKGSGANRTYIEYKEGTGSWNRGDRILVYNNTGTAYTHDSLNANTTYTYQAWSYTEWTYGAVQLHQFSDTYETVTGRTNGLATISNPSPANQSLNQSVLPELSITLNDYNGDTMNITWYSNSSGSWLQFAANSSVSNGTYYQTNTNFSEYNTKYWWRVYVGDGIGTNSSTFWFKTKEFVTLLNCSTDKTTYDGGETITFTAWVNGSENPAVLLIANSTGNLSRSTYTDRSFCLANSSNTTLTGSPQPLTATLSARESTTWYAKVCLQNGSYDAIFENTSAWNKSFDGNGYTDEMYSVVTDQNNNVYAVGTCQHVNWSSSGYDWYIKKYNQNGVQQWYKKYTSGGSVQDRAYGATVDASGNLYVVGTGRHLKSATSYHDWWVMKFDTNGNRLFNKTFDGTSKTDKAYAVAVDSNNSVYVVGLQGITGTTFNPTAYKWWIKKMDSNGKEILTGWNKSFSYDTSTRDSACAVDTDTNGNVYVVGYKYNSTTLSYSVWLKKYNSTGVEDNTNWNKTIDDVGGDAEARSVTIDANDNVFITGFYAPDVIDYDWWIKKYSSAGVEDTTNWNITTGIADTVDEAYSIVLDHSNLVSVGGTGSGLFNDDSGYDWWIKHYNTTGVEDTIDWNLSFQGKGGSEPETDYLNCLAVDENDSLYAGGYGLNLNGSADNDWWLKKFQYFRNNYTVNVTVLTNESTGVEETNATLHGYLISDGGESCIVRFFYGPTISYGTNTTNQTKNSGDTFYAYVPEDIIGTLYERFNEKDDDNVEIYGNNHAAQGFEVGNSGALETHYLLYVKLLLYRENSPGIINVSVWSVDGDGKPKDYYATGTTDGDTLTTDTAGEWREIRIPPTVVQASGEYGLFVSAVDGDASNAVHWRLSSDDNNYAGGVYVNSSDGGVSWTVNTDQDLLFEEYGDTDPYLDPGTFYHFQAFANNTQDSDTGTDRVFLTKPICPTDFTITGRTHTQINLSWTKGSGANKTYIERNTVSAWAFGAGDEVYNGTGTTYQDTGLYPSTTYYYQAWSYAEYLYNSTNYFRYSDENKSDSTTTKTANKYLINKTRDCYSLEINLTGTQLYGYVNQTKLQSSIDTSWHYVALTYDGSTMKLFKDGALVNSTSLSVTLPTTAEHLTLGKFLTGKLDEVRISNVARSASWINTTYYDTYSPGTFATFGDAVGVLSTWNYRKLVTFNQSFVSFTLTNFPVLVYNASDTDLRDNAQSTGNDIIFVSTSEDWATGTWRNKLDHEIEYYHSGTGNLVAWVRLPTLIGFNDDTENTTIYMYYNNSLCTSNRENPTGVWNSDYHGVWHMSDTGVTGNVLDSTSYDNYGKASGGPTFNTTGIVAGAMLLDGNNDYVYVTDPADGSLDFGTEDFMIEAWIKTTEDDTRDIISKISDNDALGEGYVLNLKSPGGVLDGLIGEDNARHDLLDGMQVINDGTWHHIGVTFDRDDWSYYIYDGLFDSGTDISDYDGNTSNSEDLEFGKLEGGLRTYYLAGTLDEIRILNTVQNDSWINASYNCVVNATYFTIFSTPDVRNIAPSFTDVSPSDEATGQDLNPTLSVMVNDSNADLMNISFWTNASGTWQRIGGWHTGYNNTYIDTNATSMNQYNTIYYWSVNATDDELWTNTTYSFSTNDWLPGYNYRKALTITGQGGSGPNYQINISLGSSSGGDFHLQGNAVDFPNDIRFTDNDKVTLLEYWIENMSADPITVWVKVNDTLNTTQTIYVYYGNSTATTTSDGEDTFVFFDDFETDLSKWTTWCQCGDAHVERNNTNSSSGDWSVYVYTSAGSCRAFLNLTQTVTTNFAVEFNWSVKGDNNEYHNFVLYEGLGTTFFGNIYATDSTPPTNFAYYDGSLHLLTAAYTTAMEWHSIEEHYNLSSDSYHIYIDDALNKEDAPFVSAVSELNQLKFQSGAGSNNGHQFIDTFRIRKWNDPEPSFSTAGAQETPS